MKPKIKIDIVSDVVCPWCYIGKKRFEKAVEELSEQFEFEIDYKAFELHPEIKDYSTNLREYLISKYGDEDRVNSMTDQVIAAAHEEGISMNFEDDKIVPNTLLAHKLLKLINNKVLKAKMKEALMKAYFTDNINVGDQKELLSIGKSVGVSSEILNSFSLNTNTDIVLEEQNFYRKAGINAVPSFIINDKHLVQGAQSTETFINALNQIGNPSASSNSCAPGSGCC